MQAEVYRVSADDRLERVGLEQFDVREGEQVFWVDVRGALREELAEFLEPLDLHPLALEASLDPSPRALIAPFERSLVFRLPYLDDLADTAARTLTVLCVERAVVTIHDDEHRALERLAALFVGEMRLQDASASGILYHALDQHVDHSMELVLRLRDRVDELTEMVADDTADSSELNRRSASLKRKVSRLSAAIEDQDRCARAIQAVESSVFTVRKLQVYMRDTVANSEYALRVLERQGGRLNETRQELQMRLHDKADARLRLLTIISAVFLPLTLITGIYGMNFERMPELGWRLGYPLVLLFMLALAVALLLVFRRKKWFQ